MGNLTPDIIGDCSYKQSATTMKTAINEEHKPEKQLTTNKAKTPLIETLTRQ